MPARRRRPVMPGHQCVLLAALVTLASLASGPSPAPAAVPPLGDVLDRDAPNADADSNSLSICSAALAKACDERADMRLAGCRVCCGTHQHALRSAGCTADDCEDYCITHSSVGTPLKQRRSGVNVHRGGMPGDGAPSPAPEVMAKMCAAAQVRSEPEPCLLESSSEQQEASSIESIRATTGRTASHYGSWHPAPALPRRRSRATMPGGGTSSRSKASTTSRTWTAGSQLSETQPAALARPVQQSRC